jgi:hypothetical protein
LNKINDNTFAIQIKQNVCKREINNNTFATQIKQNVCKREI